MSSSLLGGLSSAAVYNSGNQNSTIIILIIIAVIITLRTYRGFKGTKFSKFAVYFRPIFYTVATLISLFLIFTSYIEILYLVIAIAFGCLIGLKMGGGVRFFEKDYVIYFKRSALIITLWLASFIARFAVDYFYSSNFYVNLAAELLLGVTTGMLIGEAYHINDKYKKHINKTTG